MAAVENSIDIRTRTAMQFFDPTKKTKVSTDASKNCLGAVLLQADDEIWKPVAYASRSMTDSECRHAQIEKVFGISFWDGKVS